MEIEDLIANTEDVVQDAEFRAGLVARKNISLTGEKLIEFKNGFMTSSYQFIDRDKIVSTKLDYTAPKKPFILSLVIFGAGLNVDRISFVEGQFPMLSAFLSMVGGLTFLYGLAKIRKEHIVKTNNPDVNLSLPRRGKSTKILNEVTEKL
jgi:hypothetical protein